MINNLDRSDVINNDTLINNRNIYNFSIDRNNDYEALNQDDDYTGDNSHLSDNRRNWPLIRIGCLVMFAPLFMALFYGVSYADPGAEVILWFSFLTIPLGLLIILSTALTRLLVRYFWRVNRR